MTEDDPFADSEGLSFQGSPVFVSRTRYYLAGAIGQSSSLIGESADLAAMWVCLNPKPAILERQLRRDPDRVYGDFFAWLDEAKLTQEDIIEAREIVAEVVAQVSESREQIDPESLGDGEGSPGK